MCNFNSLSLTHSSQCCDTILQMCVCVNIYEIRLLFFFKNIKGNFFVLFYDAKKKCQVNQVYHVFVLYPVIIVIRNNQLIFLILQTDIYLYLFCAVYKDSKIMLTEVLFRKGTLTKLLILIQRT